MPNFKEAIEGRVGPIPNYVDTSESLFEYYSDDTLACHGIRFLDQTHAIAYFIVPEAICGPKARPPMFDKITFEDVKIKVVTDEDDARNHLNDSVVVNDVHIKVVPGHNIAGLIAEVMAQKYNQGREQPADLMLTDSAFIRYRGLILPKQEIVLAGDMTVDDEGVIFSPDIMFGDQTKAKAQKFHCEVVDPIDEETKAQMMYQHWLIETSAQGLGSVVSSIKGKVPVLGQCEKSLFSKIPIKASDLITTRLELLASPTEQGFGNTEIFVNGTKYGSQRRLMVQFFPIEMIAEGIVNARGN